MRHIPNFNVYKKSIFAVSFVSQIGRTGRGGTLGPSVSYAPILALEHADSHASELTVTFANVLFAIVTEEPLLIHFFFFNFHWGTGPENKNPFRSLRSSN